MMDSQQKVYRSFDIETPIIYQTNETKIKAQTNITLNREMGKSLANDEKMGHP